MKISLLLSTRGRPEKLEKCLNAISETADPKNYEIAIGLDEDDTAEQQVFDAFSIKHPNIYYQKIMFKRPYRLNDKFNELGRKANNEILLSWANDLVVKIKGWDEIIIDKFKQFKDNIYCCWINDGAGSETLPRHYAIHKDYAAQTGNYARGDLIHYFSDNWIYNVITSLSNLLGEKRYDYLQDISVEHSSPVLMNVPVDEMIKSEMNQWFNRDKTLYENLCRSGFMGLEVYKLYEYIREFRRK